MFDTVPRPPLAGVGRAVDDLLDVTSALDPAALDAASPAELLAALRQVQQVATLAAADEQTVLAHAITADVFADHGYTSPSELLVDQQRIDRAEAHARVRRARRAEPRTTLQGQPLPPKFEQLAAAQANGAVSGAHVDQATVRLTRIERTATLDQLVDAEQRLVTRARTATPESVAALGREILHDLDPDGPEPRDTEKRRALSVKQATDGLGTLTGTLRPEDLAKLETLLSPLAAPRPENDQTGERDTRGVAQRRYDAFVDLLDRLLQSGDMPAHGGIPLTLIVTMDLDDLITRTGTARTGFGTTVPVQRLLEQAAELQVVPVITSKADGILAYGVTRRIASPGQALALIARDRGCTFPGCSRPAQWTQRHHIREVVADNGETDLDNLVLVCGHHHRNFGRWGWSVELRQPGLVDTTGHRRPSSTTAAQPRPPPHRLIRCSRHHPPSPSSRTTLPGPPVRPRPARAARRSSATVARLGWTGGHDSP